LAKPTLAGWMPGEDMSALHASHDALMREPARSHVAVVQLDVMKIISPTAGDSYAVVRLRQIELLDGDDEARARDMLIRKRGERTGKLELPWQPGDFAPQPGRGDKDEDEDSADE
jgi:hypothetical protein